MIDHGLRRKWAEAANKHYSAAKQVAANKAGVDAFENFIEKHVDKKLGQLTINWISLADARYIGVVKNILDGVIQEEQQDKISKNRKTSGQLIAESLIETFKPNLER